MAGRGGYGGKEGLSLGVGPMATFSSRIPAEVGGPPKASLGLDTRLGFLKSRTEKSTNLTTGIKPPGRTLQIAAERSTLPSNIPLPERKNQLTQSWEGKSKSVAESQPKVVVKNLAPGWSQLPSGRNELRTRTPAISEWLYY